MSRRARWLLIALTACASSAAAQGVPPADWPMPGRDHALTRFSPLARLTPATVAGLKPLWTFGTGNLAGHEGNPLVVGGRLYLLTPWPNVLYAFDLDRPGDPPLWRYAAPTRGPTLSGCCDLSNRGLGWRDGTLYLPLFTGDLAAIDAATGKERWRVRVGDPATGATLQGAPLVAGDVVVVGVGGGEFGVRGYLSAHDARTGRALWRGYSTGPDTEVLLEGPATLAYPSHAARNLGTSTWSADSWARGGGATWGWLSYDPDLDLVYHGTGAPAPMNPLQRIGDNKWTASLLARELRTGRVRWAVQLTPADRWGYDATNENILTELSVGGRAVRALVHFDRNGFAYTIDRVNGRILVADKYGPANWARGVDLRLGVPEPDPATAGEAGALRGICPSLHGMKGFQPAAWSPETKLFYVPLNNVCMDLTPSAATFTPGRAFLGATVRLAPGPGGNLGRFIAWDAVTSSIAWEVREPFPVLGGALVTAGGLVFYGTLDGWFKALDATTGRELWRFRAPSGIVGNPISFSAPDGRQYVAVVAGVGGWPGLALSAPASAGPTAGLGAVGLLGGLRDQTNPGGVLLVFGL